MSKYGPLLFSMFFSSALQADALQIIGEVPVKISTTTSVANRSVVVPKTITLQKIQLTPAAKIALKGRINELEVYGNQSNLYRAAALPVRIYLGMTNTPVLDQGAHGSCVTFAITAGIDAALVKGDYISQLCSLQLGNYLVSARLLAYSGWNGSWGATVFSQVKKYGIVTKAYQLRYGCPTGIKAYPLYSSVGVNRAMTIAQYMAVSQSIAKFSPIILATVNTTFSPNFNPTTLLNNVEIQIRAGRRVAIGFLLDETQGSAGAIGSKVKRYDTWVTNALIVKKAKLGLIRSGHEILVIGYDDTALVKGSDGRISKGLLTLRNSWGPYAGDKGNYYMSYEYFKAMVNEALAIYKQP